MLTTNALLDAAKRSQGITSDYRLARTFGVTDNTLYNYRHGRTPDDERALKLAHMAGLHPAFVLVSLAAERAKDDASRAAFVFAAKVIAATHPTQTVDILPKQLRTPDRLTMPMGKGFATMATGEREYTLAQVTRSTAPALALLGVAWISGRKTRLKRGSVDSVRA